MTFRKKIDLSQNAPARRGSSQNSRGRLGSSTASLLSNARSVYGRPDGLGCRMSKPTLRVRGDAGFNFCKFAQPTRSASEKISPLSKPLA
jgi:hypothetical protein